MQLVSGRLHILNALRSQLEASIPTDRLHWRIRLSELLSIYKEIEDCRVTQALARYG